MPVYFGIPPRRLLPLILVLASLAFGQDPQQQPLRTVYLERVIHNEPTQPAAVKVGAVTVNEPPFQLKVTAEAGEEWLRGVELTLRNMTNRTIVGAMFNLDFPDTERAGRNRTAYGLRIGRYPERMVIRDGYSTPRPLPQLPPLNVPPKMTFTVMLGPDYSAMMQAVESSAPGTRVNSVWIRVRQVFFSDGSRWNGGFEVPDPNDPQGYIRAVDEDFRPGCCKGDGSFR